jgi:hypothetical protein
MNMANFFLNLTIFSRACPISMTYKGVAHVHMMQLDFTMSNSQSRRRDSLVMSEQTT